MSTAKTINCAVWDCGKPLAPAATIRKAALRLSYCTEHLQAMLARGLKDHRLLHPNGSCTCNGEGICGWCQKWSGPEDAEVKP